MAQTLNRDSVNRRIQENPFIGRDPAELEALLKSAKEQQLREQGQAGLQAVGGALQTPRGFVVDPQTGRVSSVATGVTPTKAAKPDRIAQLIESQQIRGVAEREKEERKTERELEKTETKDKTNLFTKAVDKGILLDTPFDAPIEDIRKEFTTKIAQQVEEKGQIAISEERREQVKFERKEKEIEEKNKLSTQLIQDTTNELLDSIREVKKGSKFFGPFGAIPAVPGIQSEKVLWQANLDKLLSKRILALMTELKSASRTGATGFGQHRYHASRGWRYA